MLSRLFTEHPRSIGEGYFAHQRAAFGFAFWLLLAGCAALIHGLVPCLCQTTGSRTVAWLNDRMTARNRRAPVLQKA